MVTKNLEVEKKINKILTLPQLDKEFYQNFIQRAKDLQTQMNDESFRITVVGEFSAGKSTFLNALIGKDILPHSVNETTATVTYIKNIKATDPLCNKVLVEFSKNKDPIIIDMPKDSKGLTEYVTTMAKEFNVVQEVSAVTIHIDFPYTDEPIEFIDTPGLNGVAEGHYERTRYEIQRAHTSIYLLPTRGLSQSNVQMYELLKQYQSSFIFIINAIDTLKESEGETVQQKITELRKQLANIGLENNSMILGVSSLLALTAKDKEITRLSQHDTLEMTDTRRQMLLEKSNFKMVEDEIWQRLTNSEKEKLKQQNIEYKLKALVQDITTEFEEQVAIHEVKIDERQLKEIEYRINVALQSKDENLINLHNFTSAKKIDIRSMLMNRIKSDLGEFYKKQETKIANEITGYTKLQNNPEENLKKLQENLKRELQHTEGSLTSEYIKIITGFLNEVYESAVLRIESHYPKISISKKKVEFTIALKKENLENLSTVKKIEKTSATIKDLRLQERTVLAKYTEENANYSKEKSGMQSLRKQKISLQSEHQREIQHLGRRPEIEHWTESYKVEKSGVFSWVGRKIGLGGYETRTRTITDDSRRKTWDEQERRVKSQYSNKEAEVKRMIIAAEQRVRRYEESSAEADARLQQLKFKLQSLQSELSSLEREKKEIFDRNKQLYYSNQKKEILYALEQYLTGDLAKFYRQEIETILNKELPKMNNAIDEHYMQTCKMYIGKLQRLKEQVEQKATPQQLIEAQQNLHKVLKTLA
ncbi:dynamin family protein [Exiguobacterium sp. S22-S28]|uniref:dynamin family protein n=1 Tax=Exiguobacterium sp. S22-S28 TaxID=3342768 RepID=UPI00372D836D